MPATMKYSRQREAIKDYLKGRKDHPTAEQVYEALREQDPKISLGTVYRNLALLSELGEIRKIAAQVGPDHFDADTSMHFHFICRQCQKMSDIPIGADADRIKELKMAIGSSVDSIELVAYGRCAECEAKKPQEQDG